MLGGWLNAVLDILFPPRCPACRQWVGIHGAWCARCFGELMSVRQIPLAEHRLKYLDECLVLSDYTGPLQRLIRDMKFRSLKQHAPSLTYVVEQGMKERSGGMQARSVIPVPLSRQRLKERGFNQTEAIFKPWAAKQGLNWLDGLERIRLTAPQWELNLTERRKNIKGAFRVTRPEDVKGHCILLVDDIFTTGITLDECAKVLKQAGAVKVKALTLASGAR
ncbi:MAG TPA: ComF family protein [Methylomusa anaerophila]|uniref:DNA utilization protein GntX n=1 Tax=Methylomusa anaerophila TaxID=1930071 RepID=A0A348AKT8_9FIRM|nr:ComF family protein [Methylomusa anaerophila]BBB91686.1 DNA utilization protein GntX [Methylomusa anaerophila]HML88580.1 ComF family protein [Methylomusa anaerophila]